MTCTACPSEGTGQLIAKKIQTRITTVKGISLLNTKETMIENKGMENRVCMCSPVAVLTATTMLRHFPGTEKEALGRKPERHQFADYCRRNQVWIDHLNKHMLSSMLMQWDPPLLSTKNKHSAMLLGHIPPSFFAPRIWVLWQECFDLNSLFPLPQTTTQKDLQYCERQRQTAKSYLTDDCGNHVKWFGAGGGLHPPSQWAGESTENVQYLGGISP